MTGSNDLDRMLASYLEEGPRRAPDRAVDAALTFANAHPRRRDPLLFLKPDVMARRTSMFSPRLVLGSSRDRADARSRCCDRRGHPALPGACCPAACVHVAVALDRPWRPRPRCSVSSSRTSTRATIQST